LLANRARFLRGGAQLRRPWARLQAIVPQAAGNRCSGRHQPRRRLSDEKVPVEEQPLHGLDLPVLQRDRATQRVVPNRQERQRGIRAEIRGRVASDSVKPEVQRDEVAVATAAAASPTGREWPRDLHPREGVVGQVHLLQRRQKEEPRLHGSGERVLAELHHFQLVHPFKALFLERPR